MRMCLADRRPAPPADIVMTRSIAKVLFDLRELGARLDGVDAGYPLQPAEFADAVSSERIAALERVAGALPSDYREFLGLCGGFTAMDFHNGYAVFGPELVARLLEEQGPPRFVQIGEVPSRVLSVGGDGGGNLFLLHVTDPWRVWKWNHELGPCSATVRSDDPALTEIGQGFTTLLERFVEDWRHFLSDDYGKWRYISG